MSEEISEDDRTTAVGIIGFSLEYFAAAVAAHEKLEAGAPAGIATVPVYNLAGQSIELALKAFLRQQGTDPAKLKKMLHNLNTVMDQAEAAGLEHFVDRQQLSLLNQEYAAHRFRYIRTGYVQLLTSEHLFRLTAAVFEPCIVAIPTAWRFMWRPSGKVVSDAGWLSPTSIKKASPAEKPTQRNRKTP